MIKRLLPLLLLVAGVGLLSACGGSKKASSSGPQYPACQTDQHCAPHNQVCSNGICVQCRDASQCGGGCNICEAGRCERKRACCTSRADCPQGLMCTRRPGEQGGTCK